MYRLPFKNIFRLMFTLGFSHWGFANTALAEPVNIKAGNDSIKVALLGTHDALHSIKNPHALHLSNAVIISQDETQFFIEELKAMGQLCDLKNVDCISSVGQMLKADLVIQVWTEPSKNDVFRFIDIPLKQEIHRQLISKNMTDHRLMKLIENNFADLYSPKVMVSKAQITILEKSFKKTALISKRIRPQSKNLKNISGWSAIGVGSLSSIVGSLFYFAHPAHYLTTPSDASSAQQTQIQNEQQDKKNIAYTLWTSGTVLTMAGIVHLVHEEVNE